MSDDGNLRILSTLAVKGAFAELAARFQAASGVRIEADFAPTLALLDRLRRGEAADVVILTREGLSEMLGEHRVAAASYVDIAQSWVGIAVKAGRAASRHLDRRCAAHRADPGPRGRLFAHRRQRHPVRGADRAARASPTSSTPTPSLFRQA